ncbi:MAG: rhodanese-like domain-containing protein [Gallionellaceae bacterium]|nr:MAG: rhodanese-like domain-containing protein [Gallionellaceae bacterium]
MGGYKNISVTELQALRAEGKVKLVDVRTDAEVARGVITGAQKLPLHLLPMRIREMDANAPTVFYCQMGGRSAQAAAFAANQGMSNIYNLQGGITAWAQSGGEIAI